MHFSSRGGCELFTEDLWLASCLAAAAERGKNWPGRLAAPIRTSGGEIIRFDGR
jgi:hypothetical protein